MFNQVIGGYTNIDNLDYTTQSNKANRDDIFRGDKVSAGAATNRLQLQDDTLAPDYTPPNTKIKNHVVVINSIDRNWTYAANPETPYQFKVKLGGSSRDRFSIVSQDYKNVIAFSVDKIILPNRVCQVGYTSNLAPRLNDNAYLAVGIKGINFSSYGTNKTLNETLGIYTPLIPLPTGLSDISYLEFKNTSIQRKDYSPAPEGYISLLDISITNPGGVIASNLNDVLDIYSIFLNTSNAVPITTSDTLVIQTSTYFNSSEFRANDLIKIEGYQYHNPSYDESSQFNNWINSSSGHYVLDIAKSNAGTSLYNQLIIPMPASLSRNTGILAVDDWFSSFVMKSLSNVAIQDTGGKLINANTQSHLVVNIKTLEKKDNLFFKDFD
jgi:hypothetical protein